MYNFVSRLILSQNFLYMAHGFPKIIPFPVQIPLKALRKESLEAERSSSVLPQRVTEFLTYSIYLRIFFFKFQSKHYLLKLGEFHRHAGVPSDYLGVMGAIFVHAVKPYLEKHDQWNEEVEDSWMELFAHITRVMSHGHMYFFSEHRQLESSKSATY